MDKKIIQKAGKYLIGNKLRSIYLLSVSFQGLPK